VRRIFNAIVHWRYNGEITRWFRGHPGFLVVVLACVALYLDEASIKHVVLFLLGLLCGHYWYQALKTERHKCQEMGITD
jgi:hypothetical protein